MADGSPIMGRNTLFMSEADSVSLLNCYRHLQQAGCNNRQLAGNQLDTMLRQRHGPLVSALCKEADFWQFRNKPLTRLWLQGLLSCVVRSDNTVWHMHAPPSGHFSILGEGLTAQVR